MEEESRETKLTLSSPQLVRPRETGLDTLLQLRVVLLDGCYSSFGIDLKTQQREGEIRSELRRKRRRKGRVELTSCFAFILSLPGTRRAL